MLTIALLLVAQDWTDRAEYDLALGVRAQPAPQARLALIDQWKQRYPNSPMRLARAELALGAAQMVGDTGRILDAARDVIAADANNFTGLYWIALLSPRQALSAAAAAKQMSEAENAARKLPKAADAYFATPAGSPSAGQKTAVVAMAHRTLGWVEWTRKANDAALVELRASLALQPRNAEASAWIGTILAPHADRAIKTQAIWHLARAAFLDGDGSLPAQQRREVRELLETAYTSHHGALDGLEELGARTVSAPTPPDGFSIESATEIAQRKADEAMAQANPQLFEWVKIRRRLTGVNSDAEFRKLQASPLPTIKGYVTGCGTGAKPDEVMVGVQDSAIEEIILKLDVRAPKCPDTGLALEFEGAPASFVREPFRLTVTVETKAVRGW